MTLAGSFLLAVSCSSLSFGYSTIFLLLPLLPFANRVFFAQDEFIVRRKIWMSYCCHAHNGRAVQNNETHPNEQWEIDISRCSCYV